jgi:hypothetical protein
MNTRKDTNMIIKKYVNQHKNENKEDDKKHNNFIIKGHDNNTPFIITNMKNLVKGTTRRFRTPTPYYPRRKTGKRKQGKNKTGKKRKSASKR